MIQKLAEQGLEAGYPLAPHILTLDKRDYKAKNADDSTEETTDCTIEEQKSDFMTQKIEGTGSHAIGKKKNFGIHPEETKKEFRDFVASEELLPEMKQRGFVVN